MNERPIDREIRQLEELIEELFPHNATAPPMGSKEDVHRTALLRWLHELHKERILIARRLREER